MNTDEHGYLDSLTERVLNAIFEVSNTLGAGFLEKVYERALLKELSLRNIEAISQASFPVTYKGEYIGEYYADIPSGRQAGYRAEMRRTPGGPTFGPMPE